MACYDCEDCSKQFYSGGKCQEWEYDCPFKHLDGYNKEDQEIKNHDLEVAIDFYNKFKTLINDFKNKLSDKYNYEEILRQLENTETDLDDMVNYYPKKFKEYGYL